MQKILLVVLLLSPITLFCEENQKAEKNASDMPMESELIKKTLNRIQQLNESVCFDILPPSKSPGLPMEYFVNTEKDSSSNAVSNTADPIMKEQILASNNTNYVPTFEEIFNLTSDEMRLSACKKIYALDSEGFIQKLLKYLSTGSPEQALILNQLLPELKNEIEEPLLQLLKDKSLSSAQYRTIIYVLGEICSEKSVPLIWDELQQGTSEEMIYTCVQALANMPHSLSIEQWLQLVQNPSIPVSLLSAKAIVEYGGTYSEEQIRRILLGEIPVSQKVSEYLLEKISAYPLEILVPFFIELMNKNPNLSIQASAILSQRTGMNFGISPQLWSDWWKEQSNSEVQAGAEMGETPSANNPPTQPEIKVHQPRIRRK